MRKAKTRSPKKTKPAPKKKMDSVPALKERLEAEFAQAVKNAKWYVDEPQRLRSLFEKATQEAAKLPKHQFKDTMTQPCSRWLCDGRGKLWMTS